MESSFEGVLLWGLYVLRMRRVLMLLSPIIFRWRRELGQSLRLLT